MIKAIFYPMIGAVILFGGAGICADIWEHNSMSGEAWIAVLVALPIAAGIIGFMRFAATEKPNDDIKRGN